MSLEPTNTGTISDLETEDNYADNQGKFAESPEGVTEDTTEGLDSSSDFGLDFDIPLVGLSIKEAAQVLGKSLRSLERSILGKWGNKLPDGWQARKVHTASGQEWRLIPPHGFGKEQIHGVKENFEAGLYAEVTSNKKRLPWAKERQSLARHLESPAIVIDRTDEVEHLLREVVQIQRQLSEERRLRLEDLRLITQMQGSMRLLETNASETSKLKDELLMAKKEFQQLKDQYLALANAPWWKRLFKQF